MIRTIFLVIMLAWPLFAQKALIFGVIATIEKSQMEKNMAPLIAYLETRTGRQIRFETGFDYSDTIRKFADGTFDLGYIGPAPYIETNEKRPGFLVIAAGLESASHDDFRSVIVARKDSDITALEALKGKRFAFGSPHSTLSYYVPMEMLIRSGMIDQLDRYDFLGRHDKVAEYVIMGKYDAGAIKHSVAKKFAPYLHIVAMSEAFPDFLVVCNTNMAADLREQITQALLELKDPAVLHAIKKSANGFIPRTSEDYEPLHDIMRRVRNRD